MLDNKRLYRSTSNYFVTFPRELWEVLLEYIGQVNSMSSDLQKVCRLWLRDIHEFLPLKVDISCSECHPKFPMLLSKFKNVKSIDIQLNSPAQDTRFVQEVLLSISHPRGCLVGLSFNCDDVPSVTKSVRECQELLESFKSSHFDFFCDDMSQIDQAMEIVCPKNIRSLDLEQTFRRAEIVLQDDLPLLKTFIHRLIEPENLQAILSRAPLLKHLSIQMQTPMSRMKSNLSLRTLVFEGSGQRNFMPDIQLFCINCPNLQVLTVSRLYHLHRLSDCTSLMELDIQFCDATGDEVGKFVASFPRLKLLQIWFASDLAATLNVTAILCACPLLEFLKLRNCSTEESIIAPNLKMLHLENIRCLTQLQGQNLETVTIADACNLLASSLATLVAAAPHLQHLTVFGDLAIPEGAFIDAKCLLSSDSLEELVLLSTNIVTDRLVASCLEHCTKLRSLHLTTRSPENVFTPQLRSETLESFLLSNDNNVLHEVIPRICAPKLKSMTFEKCLIQAPSLTEGTPNLQSIELIDSPLLSLSFLHDLESRGVRVFWQDTFWSTKRSIL